MAKPVEEQIPIVPTRLGSQTQLSYFTTTINNKVTPLNIQECHLPLHLGIVWILKANDPSSPLRIKNFLSNRSDISSGLRAIVTEPAML